MQKEENVRLAFKTQHDYCIKLGSPFTARLLQGLGKAIDKSTKSGKLILEWQGQPDAMGDSVPLRLVGALHALVRNGQLKDLAKLYPPNPLPDQATLIKCAMNAIKQADDEIYKWLQFTPQTNEVARSAILYSGLMEISKQTNLPIELYEVGASAGLNLFMDKFAYQFGNISLGHSGSPILLSPQWRGEKPPIIEPKIISRHGCDQNPLDITNKEHCEGLLAYIWADQKQRLLRVQNAIKIAQNNPPNITKADAADWVEEVFAKKPSKGVTRVLFHSIAFQYFPEQSKQRITNMMEKIGKKSTNETPLAWLAFENLGQAACLNLQLWPSGKTILLGKADAHCNWVEWLGY